MSKAKLIQNYNEPEKIDVFGIQIANTFLGEVVQLLKKYEGPPAYICFPSTNFIAQAKNDANYRKVLNSALMAMPDGKFTEFYCRLKGSKKIRSISGYWLLDSLLKTSCSHFFYGLLPKEIAMLKEKIPLKYPEAKIVGYLAPPIVNLSDIKDNQQIIQDILFIKKQNPNFIWVGISTPKQDYLMNYYCSMLNNANIMLGVGAALRYISGIEKISPEWMKNIGMRWLYRLILKPSIYKRIFPGMFLFIKFSIIEFFNKLKTE